MPTSRFESVSRPRVLCLHLFVILPRLAVASVLFLAGARFLLFTISLPDLILNAMALGFVLDFDEMLFTFLPKTVQHALQSTTPLQVRHWLQSQHVHQRPLAFLVVAIFGSLFFYAETSDIVLRMDMAQDLLCGGRTSLVFAVNPATGVVTAAPTQEEPLLQTAAYEFRAMVQLTGIEGTVSTFEDLSHSLGNWEPGVEDLYTDGTVEYVKIVSVMSPEEALAELPCVDLDESLPYLASVNGLLGHETLYTCSELNSSCSDATVRLLCPQTCHCDDLMSGIYDRKGCIREGSATCDVLAQNHVPQNRPFF